MKYVGKNEDMVEKEECYGVKLVKETSNMSVCFTEGLRERDRKRKRKNERERVIGSKGICKRL